MTYFVVFYRQTGFEVWWLADQRSIENTYQNYPVMWQTREKAEGWAAGFRKECGDGYETAVVEITVTPPGS